MVAGFLPPLSAQRMMQMFSRSVKRAFITTSTNKQILNHSHDVETLIETWQGGPDALHCGIPIVFDGLEVSQSYRREVDNGSTGLAKELVFIENWLCIPVVLLRQIVRHALFPHNGCQLCNH